MQQAQPTIIEEIMDVTDVIHSDDYAMKLVLINGLRVKPVHCNTRKLKQLLQNKGILFKAKDKDKTLLKKLKDNIIAVSVHEIHDILNLPIGLQKQKDDEVQRILGKTPPHPDTKIVFPVVERSSKTRKTTVQIEKTQNPPVIAKNEQISSNVISSGYSTSGIIKIEEKHIQTSEKFEVFHKTTTVSSENSGILENNLSAQPAQPNSNDATDVGRPASISAISTGSRTSNAADIQNVLNQLNHVGENLGKILENK